MRALILRHYAHAPVESVVPMPQPEHGYKPNGLWVSEDSDPDTSWPGWCGAESYDSGWSHVYDVALHADANVLHLKSVADIDDFTMRYGVEPERPYYRITIDWPRVARKYDGIVIAPYQWARRMTDHTMWYYGWDCASGCIWNPRAIASFRLQAVEHVA